MSTPHVSVIIVHWQTSELLNTQLATLAEDPSETMEVIVVDNSGDLPANLPKKFSALSLQIMKPAFNRGYGGGANLGAQQARGKWLLFLNPDVIITRVNLIKWLEHATVKQLEASTPDLGDNYRQPLPSLYSALQMYTPLKRILPRSGSPTTLVGGCLLLTKQLFDQLGGWDERFFIWFEDSDLSKRIYETTNKVEILPDVNLTHQGGASFNPLSSSQRHNLFFNALRIFAHKHWPRWQQKLLTGVLKRYTTSVLLPADATIRASIVIPNMRYELLETFLKTNLSTFSKQDEVIVVSSAAGLDRLIARYPEVIFIKLSKNMGFADTVNIGLRRARGTYVGTVNDDVVLPKHWLEMLLDSFKNNVASVSPTLIKPNGEIESNGVYVLPQGKALTHRPETKNFIASFNAACVVFSREALEKTGLFDTRFGSYLEDVDLGLRFHQAGWQNVVATEVQVTHLGHQTSQAWRSYKQWLDVKNWWLVMLKNYSLVHWLRYLPAILEERVRNVSGLVKAMLHHPPHGN
ncbi:MAG TPA: glycosyltransferase [Vitreimonas sp.]|nr:glycosyltransferase [Vitreimonas sp.]